MTGETRVRRVDVSSFTIPTGSDESDGTFEWDATTIVIVRAFGGDETGLGYAYTSSAAAEIIRRQLESVVVGQSVHDVEATWWAMHDAIRNLGRPGIVASAISAVDNALWDLKARDLGIPLVRLLGSVHARVPVYGSAGFTSHSTEAIGDRFSGWAEERGITRFKMKIGRGRDQDLGRIEHIRDAIGSDAELFVDANGAYQRKEALAIAEAVADHDVTWFEEPVSSDDLEGLRLIRDRAPAGIEIAAGEYGYDVFYFMRMLDAGAVDVLQADATRCAGITGFLKAAVLAEAHTLDISAHTAPNLHVHVCAAIHNTRHIEYFSDHARIERMLFDGVLEVVDGYLQPDLNRTGNGLSLRADALARLEASDEAIARTTHTTFR
jgi:L-alanine-DL-glutamate epimerase-like enolase superfamily enzyme